MTSRFYGWILPSCCVSPPPCQLKPAAVDCSAVGFPSPGWCSSALVFALALLSPFALSLASRRNHNEMRGSQLLHVCRAGCVTVFVAVFPPPHPFVYCPPHRSRCDCARVLSLLWHFRSRQVSVDLISSAQSVFRSTDQHVRPLLSLPCRLNSSISKNISPFALFRCLIFALVRLLLLGAMRVGTTTALPRSWSRRQSLWSSFRTSRKTDRTVKVSCQARLGFPCIC